MNILRGWLKASTGLLLGLLVVTLLWVIAVGIRGVVVEHSPGWSVNIVGGVILLGLVAREIYRRRS